MEYTYKKSEHAMLIINSLEEMRQSQIICDFIIKVESESLPVHRTVLAACSDYFRAMFSHNMKEALEGFVVMKDVDARTVQQCIEFMYTGESTITAENAPSVLYAAELMQLNNLKMLCFTHLQANLNVDNCFYVKFLAHKYNCDQLGTIAEKFIINNFKSLISSAEFLQLGIKEVQKLFTNANEEHEVMWESAMNWVKYQRNEREKYLLDVLNHLGMGRFPFHFLLNTVWKEKMITENEIIQEYISNHLFSDLTVVELNICLENCFILRKIIEQFGSHKIEKLFQLVNNFMFENFDSVIQTEEFKHLNEEYVLYLFQDSRNSSSRNKWNAALLWVKYKPERKDVFSKLFRYISIEELGLNFIESTVKVEELVKGSHECKDMIIDGLCSLAKPQSMYIALYEKESGKIYGYNVKKNTWKNFPHANFNKNMKITSINLELYCFSENKLFKFAKDGNWERKADIGIIPTVYNEIVSARGMIYVIDVEQTSWFDPELDYWTTINTGCDLRSKCVAANEEFIYVLGSNWEKRMKNGEESYVLAHHDTCKFIIEEKRWTKIARTKDWFGKIGEAVSLNDAIYAIKSFQRICERYDQEADRWENIPKQKFSYETLSACVCGDKIYTVGKIKDQEKNQMETYDESENEWRVEKSNDIPLKGSLSGACLIKF